MEPTELRDRARRAYELGRVRVATRAAGAALLIAATAVALGRPLDVTALLCAALLVLAGALAFRGGASGRAAWLGLSAGSAAMLLPIGLMTAGCAVFGPGCMRFCLPACVAGGAVMGAVLALLAAREEQGGGQFLLASIAVAGLAASFGCTLAGAAGVAGMALGTLGAGTPVWLAVRAQR
ncbi:MAG: hypothetical protein ACJ79H_09800 [Myxococcales bacterium]